MLSSLPNTGYVTINFCGAPEDRNSLLERLPGMVKRPGEILLLPPQRTGALGRC